MSDLLRHAPPVLLCLDELAHHFNTRALSIVEVGVFRGDLTQELLRHYPQSRYHAVDPWKSWQAGDSFYGSRQGKLVEEQWDSVFEEFSRRFSAFLFAEKKIYRSLSAEASELFDEESVHFVFLDGDHSYEHVSQDIVAWLPKVKVGGILAGHDYGGSWRGVKRAVDKRLGDVEVYSRERVWVHRKVVSGRGK